MLHCMHRTRAMIVAISVFVTARRYVRAVYAVAVCLSVRPFVRPSVTSRYYIEQTGRIKLIFGTGVSFYLSYNVL